MSYFVDCDCSKHLKNIVAVDKNHFLHQRFDKIADAVAACNRFADENVSKPLVVCRITCSLVLRHGKIEQDFPLEVR